MDLIRCFAADSITDTSTGLSTVLSHDTTSECYQRKTTAVFFFFFHHRIYSLDRDDVLQVFQRGTKHSEVIESKIPQDVKVNMCTDIYTHSHKAKLLPLHDGNI